MTKEEKLLKLCRTFIDDHNISCGEQIYDTDKISEDATTFIEDICDLVGYKPYEDDE